MAEDIRSFMCRTEAGAEKLAILDIMVLDEHMYLIAKGAREKPYVFEIMYNGIRVANRTGSEEALAKHQEQVEKAMAHAD